MSKKETWWLYVKNILRQYPDLKKELDALKSPKVTVSYGGVGGRSGKIGRPTEVAALAELEPKKQKKLDAIEKAIVSTKEKHPNDYNLRLMIVDLVYWKKTHTIQGASMRVPCHPNTAAMWQAEFIRLVADELDLV